VTPQARTAWHPIDPADQAPADALRHNQG